MTSEQDSDKEDMMKRLIMVIGASMVMASAGASHVYQGLAEGDPNLYGYGPDDQGFVGVQPGVGDRVDIYQGFGPGNDDLFPTVAPVGAEPRETESSFIELPRVYRGFSRNPDLSW
jgi:hypothetical protein